MATAYTYTFSKRHNSTAVPTGGTSVTVELKGGCDLLAPIFTLSLSGTPTFNYMQFGGRYYFVTNIRSVRNNLWDISCAVDVLATYKASIQATTAHVLYYTHTNTQISDHRLSVETSQTTSSSSAHFGQFGTDSAYVLTVVGKDAVAAFAMVESSLQGLIDQNFFDTLDNNLGSITPVDDSVDTMHTIADSVRWFADMLQTEIGSFTYSDNASRNIRSCHILPLPYASIGGTVETVYLGRMDSGHTGLHITNRIFSESVYVSIPWQASDWRRNAPYHEIFLYIPCIGLTSISPSDVIGESTLIITVGIDKFSGDTIIEVNTSSKTVAYYTTNVATAYPIGASQVTPMQSATALGSAVAAVATSANPAISAGMVGLGLANALQPNVTCIGANGGGAILGVDADKVTCYTVFHDTTVSPSSVSSTIGTPCNASMSLSGISGYVQTQKASVAGSMTDTERQQINQLLDGGIYIE